MAISPDTPIDFAKIALEMRATVARWYNAQIEIVDPEFREQTWNVMTNTFGADTAEVIYSGSARIQPIRETKQTDMGIGEGAIRSVRVQVPYDANLELVQKGFEVRITDGGEDAVLENLKLVVKSAINSSYGWNRTIECDADVKSIDSPSGGS